MSDPKEIVLEFDGDERGVSGRLRDGAADSPFSGWLTLLAALEAARPSAAGESAEGASRELAGGDES